MHSDSILPLTISHTLYFPLSLSSPSLSLSLSSIRAGKCVSKQIGKGVFVAGAAAAVVGGVALAAVAVSNATEDMENKEEKQ
jgi:hypothetical protein